MQICLYGASSNELDAVYLDSAYELGLLLARRGHSLIYGAGAQGVMGAAARGVHDGGGRIIGVAPKFLNVDGILYDRCDELIFTDTMAERKGIMAGRAEAFIMAPGGVGTFEEFFEILTLKQLGRHNPPIAIYNVNNYYAPLQQMLEHAVRERFMREPCLQIYRLFSAPAALLDYIETYDASAIDVHHLKNI